ncbi:NAD(P)/FAD-dependent oxidoreductase [Aspergillus candidus]|uniref:Putative FAD dependent oxidoreductase n=1 Tax=Aspergillus candidus TaxID=41067 RepID=A0A2I2FK89_ASPCN|nr:putative FAD dependent oxidoreductase [Aspergillus candidus]PLB41033.1 putative FAD dependent oxidoreductase [Aspergillus candidus]
MAFVQASLFDPAIPLKARQDALKRALSDPGIPATPTTTSFWLKQPHPKLAKAQSSTLPSQAEIVIIGSGITGTSIARTILKGSRGQGQNSSCPKIVILEARNTCSGATGRNGGHILETVEEFTDFEAKYGLEAAKKITRFRLAHLPEILSVADEYGLTEESQTRKVQFLSAYFDEEKWQESVRCIRRFKECMPEEAAEWKIFEREDIPEKFGLSTARGVIAGPAGALWPYRFVTGVLARLHQEFPGELCIETNTPVTAIHNDHNTNTPDLPCSVVTARGKIRTRHVIHCTNAHVGHLVPGLRGRIYPIRGQMSAQNAGVKFINQGTENSWLFNYERGFDYLTQLPSGGQADAAKMMFGGGFAQGQTGGVADIGISTDSELSFYADIHLSGALSSIFGRENWGAVSGPSVEQMWTGNMGFSADGNPWVGRLPLSATQRGGDKDSHGAEWVACAFSGEGMVQAWLCGKALALMVLNHDQQSSGAGDLSWFPEQLLVTEDRLHDSVLSGSVDDESLGV